MRRLRFLLLAICVPLFSLAPSIAQDTASIVGTVTDSSGAAMPKVKITVSDPDKGIDRPTTTDSVGAYKVGFLPIGTYTVTAEVPGFQRYQQTDIILQVGQIQRVDVQMTVGSTTQKVTVTGSVVKVQMDDAVQSSVITSNQIAALNLNGRQFVSLATLVPGASVENAYDPTAAGKKLKYDVDFSGNREQLGNWQEDGANIKNLSDSGDFHVTPSLDAIAEFKVSTSNYGADQGSHAGIVTEISTKSGTRDFHGDAYDYVRNDVWDANPWFVNQELWSGLPLADCGGSRVGPCNAPKTPLKWNDFGYTLGGPFYIPGHYNTDKSKTFFFWSEEWRRVRQGETITSSAPTARMRNGDFSECDNHPGFNANYNSLISGCGSSLPKDPVTGKYFTEEGNGLVPVSTQAQTFLNAWVPLPNNGPVGWIASPSLPINWRQEMLRVDQNIGSMTRVYGRYTHEAFADTLVPVFYSASTYDTIDSVYGGPSYNWVLHMVHTFSPTIVNDVMIDYDHYHNLWYNHTSADSGPYALSKPSDWSMQYIFPANAKEPYLPGISVSDSTLNFAEDNYSRPFYDTESAEEMKDDLAITKGNHFLKMGFHFVRVEFNAWTVSQIGFNGTPQGELTFSNGSTVTTGSALADMDLGRIATYAELSAKSGGVPIGGYDHGKWFWWGSEPYFQDDWRATRRLTLNLGVRSYYTTRSHDELNHLDSNFIPSQYNAALQVPLLANGNLAAPNSATGQIYNGTTFGNGLVQCGTATVPSGCTSAAPLRFAPRFGFAYQPFSSPNTVIRGGYGMYWDQIDTDDEASAEYFQGNVPTSAAGTAYNVVGYGSITPGASGPVSVGMLNGSQPYPRAQQFSFGVQHEFTGNNRLGVSYVGNSTQHLFRARHFNMIPVGVTTKVVPALAGTPYCDTSGVCDVQASLINQKHSANFFVPYEGYAGINLAQMSGTSNYHSLQAEFRHTVGHGMTLQTVYTWSHMMDNGSIGGDPNVDDSNLRRYYATSNVNRAQVVNINYVYDLPFLKNASNHYVKNAFGGWQLSGITSFFTGTPVTFGCSISGHGTGIGASAMCNSLAPLKVQKGVDNNPTFGPTVQWYNPADVGQLQMSQLAANGQSGMFGYMGLDPLTGPGRNNWDIALHKDFVAPWFKGEHSTVQFRWETFNTFNHTQWQGISSGCSSATPAAMPCNYATYNGTTVNLGKGDVSSAWPSRIMQFALKFIF